MAHDDRVANARQKGKERRLEQRYEDGATKERPARNRHWPAMIDDQDYGVPMRRKLNRKLH